MRPTKTLLVLVRQELPERIERRGCLCWAIASMAPDILNEDEANFLTDYVSRHRPSNISHDEAFFWPLRELAPRLEFLDKLIDDLDNRSIKQLLILLRRKMLWSILSGENNGLCGVVFDMARAGVITSTESKELRGYLLGHKPEGSLVYWFKPGAIRPRYQFLTKLIKEL